LKTEQKTRRGRRILQHTSCYIPMSLWY